MSAASFKLHSVTSTGWIAGIYDAAFESLKLSGALKKACEQLAGDPEYDEPNPLTDYGQLATAKLSDLGQGLFFLATSPLAPVLRRALELNDETDGNQWKTLANYNPKLEQYLEINNDFAFAEPEFCRPLAALYMAVGARLPRMLINTCNLNKVYAPIKGDDWDAFYIAALQNALYRYQPGTPRFERPPAIWEDEEYQSERLPSVKWIKKSAFIRLRPAREFNCTYHVDPGHGWLEVERDWLVALGIDDEFTGFSYQSPDGKKAYLEEDEDMWHFTSNARAQGYEVSVISKEHDNWDAYGLPPYDILWQGSKAS